MGSAAYHDIKYQDETTISEITVLSPLTSTKLPCGHTDGRALQLSLSFTDVDGFTSDWSDPVTYYCAGLPMAPAPPSAIVATRDLISLEWLYPVSDGGSSVLGFKLFMKGVSDSEYTLIQDGGDEDPPLLYFTTTRDQAGAAIAQGKYSFRVSALNKVGSGPWSEVLDVVVHRRVSATDSSVSGDGVIQILSSVPASVTVNAYAEDGARLSTGGALYFLHVLNQCQVTQNYRCDETDTGSAYTELP